MPTTLELSLIEEPSTELRTLLDEFSASHNVQINLTIMHWENAWPELLAYALYGKGPDVSHVGSTWASSLIAMNALREFSTREVDEMGGARVFAAPAWQSASIPGDMRVWSIPWTSFTFLVIYRRDHLEAAGIDEGHAFDSPQDMLDTIRQLSRSGFQTPIVLPSGEPFLDRVHIAASWVWGAGGGYISDDGKRILLDRPETRRGLKAFFELYRYVPAASQGLDHPAVMERFGQGDASVVVAECGYPATLVAQKSPLVANMGSHALPGVPFVSGDNLVIWQTARQHPARERAALDLIGFLVSRSAQERLCKNMSLFPVRHDVIDALECPTEQLAAVLKETFETGRAHKPVRLWSRYELQLGHTLDEITEEVLSRPDLPIDDILETHLSALQRRFSLMTG